MSNNNLCLDDIEDLYTSGAYFETETVDPKTRVELRILKASAFIRSTPEWTKQLDDESKRQEWVTHVEDTFELADKEVEYVFKELKYYALLKENGTDGEEPAAIDGVWVNDSGSDCDLAKEFKQHTAVLKVDTAATLSDEPQVLIDPFLYPFSSKDSRIFNKPVSWPDAALAVNSPSTRPGSTGDWSQAISSFNKTHVGKGDAYDDREVAELIRSYISRTFNDYTCWLPTDFYVEYDGTVAMQSYINNLHPTRYAGLYETISKVFAKFVPLLEQVATDVINPRKLRAIFNIEECYMLGNMTVGEIFRRIRHGENIPKEYDQYLNNIDIFSTFVRADDDEDDDEDDNEDEDEANDEPAPERFVRFDEGDLLRQWRPVLEYVEPTPLEFVPSTRPPAPYSMRNLPLQVSVEMFNINLTPANPKSLEGVWQAVGRAEERIFATGLYFYDVENVASAELMFRDPVSKRQFYSWEEKEDFCMSHNVVTNENNERSFSQVVGSVEIKSGRYICYPNYYQTKMPSFELVDPTKAGHIKCIAFYIVDPTTRLLSTRIIPPQQPNWTQESNESIDVATSTSAKLKRDDLKSVHACSNQIINNPYDVRIV